MTAHHYRVQLRWTGNLGTGTASRRGYSRDHEFLASGRPVLPGSSDPAFRGNAERWNPEQLLLASLSACHQLWYLDFCAREGVIVVDYSDDAAAMMQEDADGNGRMVQAILHPMVTLAAGGDATKATALHATAHAFCFIANSVNFPVACEPEVRVL